MWGIQNGFLHFITGSFDNLVYVIAPIVSIRNLRVAVCLSAPLVMQTAGVAQAALEAKVCYTEVSGSQPTLICVSLESW